MKLIRFFFVLTALICLVALHGQEPESPDEVLNKARAALQARDGDAACELLVPLSKSEPQSAEVWRLLGLALHYQNKLDQALEASRKSLELESDSAASVC